MCVPVGHEDNSFPRDPSKMFSYLSVYFCAVIIEATISLYANLILDSKD